MSRPVRSIVVVLAPLVADAQARSAASSEALAMLATRLGGFEGRKHLVLYSSGHAMSPETQAVDAVAAAVSACTDLDAMVVRRDASSALGRLANRAASDGLRDVIDHANRAQITLYTLDPSGITTSTTCPPRAAPRRRAAAGHLRPSRACAPTPGATTWKVWRSRPAA